MIDLFHTNAFDHTFRMRKQILDLKLFTIRLVNG